TSSNAKKNKIQRPPSSTQKNKVEAHPRTVKSSLKDNNCDVEPKGTTIVQHSKLNADFELICVKNNGCMLFDNHDLCVLNVINDVNAYPKSKFVKKTSKRKGWKPTGKGTIKFENDHVAKIMGYGDYQIGNVTISKVYYVEGIGHNLFSVSENLEKLQPKSDIGIFIGYAPTKKAFRIYNRRTRRIIETIHVDFDELIAMASEHNSLEPALHEMTPATISS
nr:integrase, catalytic region, zinc finger, CCHC-type, peptidase aspartic, catalytic [Tanacetum cinerariifolium]